ncbi:MAG: biotin--[acetyl-CoA-carboxylase] ligase [Hyphomicrobiales bacterium]|nr:biotin--[acetyl-CoA-carboxylase] ligase [Hyphomicrobiales bacterium]
MSGGLAPQGAEASWRVVRLGEIDSTNEEARRRAVAGDPGRLWVVAEAQSAGRGRRGRTWVSPRGNLYATALLIDPCPPALAPQLGFVGGLALANSAHDLGATDARLKWPNDLVCAGAKCAGLLVEGVAAPGRRLACLVGIGVNCARAPAGVGYLAAVLGGRGGAAIAAAELFERLMLRFDEALADWRAGAAFAGVRAAWLDRAAGLGERIRIVGAGGAREGTFAGLDPDGRLLLGEASGTAIIEAGDLWILPGSDSPPASSSLFAPAQGRPAS